MGRHLTNPVQQLVPFFQTCSSMEHRQLPRGHSRTASEAERLHSRKQPPLMLTLVTARSFSTDWTSCCRCSKSRTGHCSKASRSLQQTCNVQRRRRQQTRQDVQQGAGEVQAACAMLAKAAVAVLPPWRTRRSGVPQDCVPTLSMWAVNPARQPTQHSACRGAGCSQSGTTPWPAKHLVICRPPPPSCSAHGPCGDPKDLPACDHTVVTAAAAAQCCAMHMDHKAGRS